jgi:hypothetical protein
MVTVGIKGGLGDQLFQYAFGKYVEKQRFEVVYNDSWFKNNNGREFILPKILNKEIKTKKSKVINYNNYWQDLKYTEPVKDILINELKPVYEIDVIGIHIRRGDFLTESKYVKLGKDYYNKGIELIQNEHGEKSIYIFSDDIPWCRENFPYPIIDKPDYLAWEILRSCKYKIISNSTFSWWAAYLSDGITIMPEVWYKDKKRQDNFNKTFAVEKWIKL